ncbi:peptidase S41 [Polaribacter batillariae]|uniref:Peptidase S41 n=1 Tax=Polaribacter batillariae TaxID=2808900 RepID=A0ABX7SY97_9FLAO|nr:S41 family peptidase [Polaribacter batillariae]QTD37966.1 peptidase S41 [Polaribacter batillariae]
MKKIIFASFLTILFIASSCSKKEEENEITEPDFVVTLDDEINFFIWKGLKNYYLWEKDVSDLADDRFNNIEELYTYFRNYDSPESTFNNLLFRPGNVDRFSWIVDDYVALENSFQGINTTTGMEFGLKRYQNSNTNVYGYVRYVIPNSSAATEKVKRGMIFSSVNGTQLTDSNFRTLLFGNNSSFSIGLANYNNGNPISNGTTISLTKAEVQENPIAVSKVITEGNKKIGYLMYNQFARNYDGELNAVFNFLKAENVSDLIIDLRYNGGGSITTASYLGSMVTGQFGGQVYSKEVWNEAITKGTPADRFINNFPTKIRNTDNTGNVILEENINSLGLTKVYFIVSGSTASASELVINSLSAYIDVEVVGTTTVGKQVGSITLYDSESLFRNGKNLNPKHTYAMQPIVLEITNKNGENYPNGIVPGTNFTGINLAEDVGDLGVLGERSDPLLDRTLTYILTGKKTFGKNKASFVNTEEIFNSKLATPASNNMFTDFK